MYKVLISGQEFIVTEQDLVNLDVVFDQTKDVFHTLSEGKSYRIQPISTNNHGKVQNLQINNLNIEAVIMDQLDQQVDSMGLSTIDSHKSNDIFAPMPGLILDILCKEGDDVEEGKSLLILEAMKMENVIKAEGSGTIGKIHKSIGNSVEKGQLIIEIN
ncbi:MAG: acetyl-CoA carboxylase biotin carboxyl carrier protein subunit [Bacteroidota bacterium]